MATIDPSNGGRFAQASSLYGPGNIAAWYFTILSVLVSWILHPRKRRSGSIDVNLVAILSLPAVAAGHVIWQGQSSRDFVSDVSDEVLIQSIAAIEAPFIITETFMAMGVILFLVAAWTYCIRRAVLVALIGLECFAVESYVHFSSYSFRYRPGTLANNFPAFSRLFVADFIGLLISIIVVLGLLIATTGPVTVIMLSNLKNESSSPRRELDRSNLSQANLGIIESARSSNAITQSRTPVRATTVSGLSANAAQETQPDSRKPRHWWSRTDRDRPLLPITLLSTILLPLSFIATLWPPLWHSTGYYTLNSPLTIDLSIWSRVKDSAVRFGQDFFPRTPCSITDLDQAVAAVAGAMALVVSIYSVAKAYHKIWNTEESRYDNEEAGRTSAGFELGNVEHNSRDRNI